MVIKQFLVKLSRMVRGYSQVFVQVKYTHTYLTFFLILICRLTISRCELRKMPWKAIDISVKCLESKDTGKANHVNVTHIVCELSVIAVGKEVVIRLNACCFRETVVDLLD